MQCMCLLKEKEPLRELVIQSIKNLLLRKSKMEMPQVDWPKKKVQSMMKILYVKPVHIIKVLDWFNFSKTMC